MRTFCRLSSRLLWLRLGPCPSHQREKAFSDEHDCAASVLETRCAILRRFGYAAFAVPTSQAEILLASQTFDLILLSATMSGEERRRIATAVGTPELWCWMD